MMTLKRLVLLWCWGASISWASAQDVYEDPQPQTHLSSEQGVPSLGVGIGLPYGGIGGRFGYNLIDRLNVFGGVGYQLAGVGFNVGIRKEFPSTRMAQFYLTGMYGTNAATKVVGLSDYDDLYAGPTVGLGFKLNSRMTEGNYWDLGLLLPFRSSKFYDTEQAMLNDPRVSGVTSAWPVLIVVGYNFSMKSR